MALMIQSADSSIEPWAVFLILAGICFVIGILRAMGSSEANATSKQLAKGDMALSRQPADLQIWNESSIAQHLSELRGQSPAVVSHYIGEVKKRWVLNQNDKTAAMRARFLKSKVEELKLFREGQQIMVDLEALALEREKRLKTLQLENAQLDETIRTRGQREKLAALKEQKQLELEIARIELEITGLRNPPQAEVRPTPEQQRAQRHAASDARLQRLKQLKQEALKTPDEDERIQKVNAIDDEIQREMEEWRKSL